MRNPQHPQPARTKTQACRASRTRFSGRSAFHLWLRYRGRVEEWTDIHPDWCGLVWVDSATGGNILFRRGTPIESLSLSPLSVGSSPYPGLRMYSKEPPAFRPARRSGVEKGLSPALPAKNSMETQAAAPGRAACQTPRYVEPHPSLKRYDEIRAAARRERRKGEGRFFALYDHSPESSSCEFRSSFRQMSGVQMHVV